MGVVVDYLWVDLCLGAGVVSPDDLAFNWLLVLAELGPSLVGLALSLVPSSATVLTDRMDRRIRRDRWVIAGMARVRWVMRVKVPGRTGPLLRPLVGAGPNFAETTKMRWLVGSRPMLREPMGVVRVWATWY